MAALLALSDMPDVPLAFQPRELLDVATVVPLREDAEFVDVPAVAQVEAAEDAPTVSEVPDVPELPDASGARGVVTHRCLRRYCRRRTSPKWRRLC